MERLELVGLFVTVLFASVIASLPFQAALYRHLEKFWPDLFAAVGSPKMFHLTSERFASPAFYAFILHRKHRTLNDRRLSRLSDINLVFLLIAVSLIFSLLLLVLVGKRI